MPRQKQPLRTPATEWGELRASAGLSLKQVAKLTGINHGIVSLIESRRLHPTPEQARRLLDAYQQEPVH